MASFRDVLPGNTLGAAQKISISTFLHGADASDLTKVFHLTTDRVDPRLMDAYFMRADPTQMPFFEFSLIHYNNLSLDNLPPFGQRLSDNQAAHMASWLKKLPKKDKESLPGNLLAYLWPADFHPDGGLKITRVSIGQAWDGFLPPELADVSALFFGRKKERTAQEQQQFVADLTGLLNGGPITIPAQGKFPLQPCFLSMNCPMDITAVLEFAETVPNGYSLHGQAMTSDELTAWLKSGLANNVTAMPPSPGSELSNLQLENQQLREEIETLKEQLNGDETLRHDRLLRLHHVRANIQHQDEAIQQLDTVRQRMSSEADHLERQLGYGHAEDVSMDGRAEAEDEEMNGNES